MTDTARLGLPMVQPAQAQKHVTVNESLLRLDGVTQLTIVSRTRTTPSASAQSGQVFAIPSGASGAWAGRSGELAIFANGGWTFVRPSEGWRAYDLEAHEMVTHDGSGWRVSGASRSPGGAGIVHRSVEIDHVIGTGATSRTAQIIPSSSSVIGVTGRVIQPIGGSLTGWALGVTGGANRYGSGLGLSTGAWIRGLTSQPLTYYTPDSLLLTAEGGEFSGGLVRLVVHCVELDLPDVA